MPRDNKTQYVILGVLASGPRSGYEINKWVEQSVTHFWKESFGQIYPMLSRLKREGLIRRSSQPTGKRERFVYHITPAGERELRDWVARAPEPAPVRNELLLKIFFARKVGPEAILPLVEAARQELAQRAAFFAEAERLLPLDFPDDPDVPYWLITLRAGILLTEARLAWANETSKTLKALAAGRRGKRRAART
jgi:PadR family transcriptional regulator, regulatory protein AphA